MSISNLKRARVVYIRELSRFINRTIALLKKSDATFEEFVDLTKKSVLRLENIKQVDLYSSKFIKQKELVQQIIIFASQDITAKSIDLDDIRSIVFKESNTIHKNRNRNKKNKIKHKNISYYDGY